jgi:hypothetical protein
MPFDQFMIAVDAYLLANYGISHLDLFDFGYRVWWEDKMTPEETAEEAVAFSEGF